MSLLDDVLEGTKNKLFEVPLFEIGGWLTVWKVSSGLNVTLCETYPYAPDGEVPYVFFDIWYIQILIDSPMLYKKLYKRKYGEELDI